MRTGVREGPRGNELNAARLDLIRFLQQKRPLDDIPQFAHIARPMVRFQDLGCACGDSLNVRLVAAVVLLHEMDRQGKDIFGMIPQGRRRNLDHTQPVK